MICALLRHLLYLFTALFLGLELCCGEALASNLMIGNFNLIYGHAGGNAVLDFVPLHMLSQDTLDDMDEMNSLKITREFSSAEKRDIELAVAYWAERMGANTPAGNVDIYAGFVDDPAGSAFSLSPSSYLIESLTANVSPDGTVYDKFIRGRPSLYPPGLADNIIIFENAYPTEPIRQLLPDGTFATMIHELGHALGIMGMQEVIDPDSDGTGTEALFSADQFTVWNSHLRDVFGKQAAPDMMISMNAESGDQAGVFQIFGQGGVPLDYRYPTFHGKNVDALTGGMGMPVMGGFCNDGPAMDGANSLGHPGVMQSHMSYGVIRNMGFTEMELAAFQDMGYAMDRSQFFGKSYYYTVGGDRQINTTPFGRADKPNTSILGLGTHVMRNGLTLTQAADIYADGYGGGGIRIDGVGNTLAVPQSVTIAANGPVGTGLLVAYGNGNSIYLDGRVDAVGSGGIGAHFGIRSSVGEGIIRSYMPDPSSDPGFDDKPIQEQYEYLTVYNDLQGPLVTEFAISGSLSGSLAAVKIEDDAHVETIAVQNGAGIAGNIISKWERNTPEGSEYATTIGFGQAGADGAMRMDGDMFWDGDSGAPVNNSLDIEQRGGHLSYNGEARVYSWRIDPGASLGGNSNITLDGSAPFLNAGRISPGNSIGTITINGDYTQSGNLLLEFTPAATDQFIVTGLATINSGASLSLQAVPAFYPTGSIEITDAKLFGASPGLGIAAFAGALDLLPIASPTLTPGWGMMGTNPVFSVTRMDNAYSQWASGATGRSLGGALPGVAMQARGDMQTLLTVLDFSSPDGSGVRSALRQLAPTVYDNTAESSLHTGHVLSGLLFDQIRYSERNRQETHSSSSAFVLPVGGYFGQDGWGDNQGFNSSFAGVMGGINRHYEKGQMGLHATVFYREVNNRSESLSRSQVNGINFGVHGNLFPHDGFFIAGLANVGVERAETDRNVSIGDYQRSNSSSYTAFTGRSVLRGGYERQVGNLSFGPLAGLGYGLYHRPSVHETGGQATRLELDAASFHSLRSALGGQVKMHAQPAENIALHAGMDAQWMYEILNTRHGSTASFADYGGNSFTVTNRTSDRNALALNAFLTLVTDDALSVNAYVGTELFRAGSNSAQGGLSIGWNF